MSDFNIFNKTCYKLDGLENNSIDAIITDPPYGISYQNNDWDKKLPDKQIWLDSFRVLKEGSFALIFSSIRLMHHLMLDLENSGFIIKDVLMWSYLNGMPKSRNVGLDIDKELNVESQKDGVYKYVQGYQKDGTDSYLKVKDKFKPASDIGKKYSGAGLGIKPAYEPIILVQKPIISSKNVAQNIIKFGTGSLNLEDTRIPYEKGEGKVGHNPHPKGRVASNILRTERFNDGYDKFFLVPKVRQNKDNFNFHPTLKPTKLMQQLVKLITYKNQTVLDPFMGSGSTGVASLDLKRNFYGYEIDKDYFEIAKKRIEQERYDKQSLLF